MRSAPRAISASASALPRDWAADGAPETCSRSMVAPSGLPTRPHTSACSAAPGRFLPQACDTRPQVLQECAFGRDGDFRIFARQLATEDTQGFVSGSGFNRERALANGGNMRSIAIRSAMCWTSRGGPDPHKPGQPRPLARRLLCAAACRGSRAGAQGAGPAAGP